MIAAVRKMTSVPVLGRVAFKDLLWHLESEKEKSVARFVACGWVFAAAIPVTAKG